MSEHTPGPWAVHVTEIPHRYGGVHTQREIVTTWDHPQLKGPLGVVCLSRGVGTVESGPVSLTHIDEADARLIANAPTMYAALQQISDMGPMSVDDQRWRIAREALGITQNAPSV